jgi:2-phospho-L-lactate guanylyltransferase
MMSGSAWAVVPVKPFSTAKLRLAAILDADERAQLARVMLEDVLDAIAASGDRLAGLIVLTADEDAAALARTFDAVVLDETVPGGLNPALTMAADYLTGDPNTSMLVIPGDLPHLSADAILQMIDLLDAPRSVALLPASGDGGTNLLACRPVDVIPPSFGPSSFERHSRAAHRAGITPRVLTDRRLGRDIDRADDLAAFLSLGTATRTHRFLSRLEIAERLVRHRSTGVVQAFRPAPKRLTVYPPRQA